MKKVFFLCVMCCISVLACAQQCKVQGIVQYYHKELGYRIDLGAEVLFVQYSSVLKVPNRQKWETYQGLVDKWINASYWRRYRSIEDAYKMAEMKAEDKTTIQELGVELMAELLTAIDKDLVKYSTVVDASGKFDITIPYGVYYVFIKSKNSTIPTLLEANNRYHLERVELKNPTKIISYDFNILLNDI